MELLTGKCKEEFEAHLLNIKIPISYAFKYFSLSMQYGVYKQFFIENGIFIHIKSYTTFDEEIMHECFINDKVNSKACGQIYTYINNSYDQIIKIANKQFNDKNN